MGVMPCPLIKIINNATANQSSESTVTMETKWADKEGVA